MPKYLDKDGLTDYTGKLTAKYKTMFASKADVGTPLVAATAAAMTDTSKIYVYTGSETGYTAGNWYYYNGSAWTSGGVYNSTAVATDKTLTVENKAADGKATGEMIMVNGTSASSTRINITTTSDDVELAEMSDVNELKNAINELADTQLLPVFEKTVSGTVLKEVTVSIPAGAYKLEVASVDSTDTQYTSSRMTFFGSGGSSWSTDINRTAGRNANITLTFDVTSIAFYGAHNYSDSTGVVFSFNGVRILEATGLSARLDSLESDMSTAEADISEIKTEVNLVVHPVAFTETAGYYSESGAIQSATSNKEVYTDKIAVDSTRKIHWEYNPNDGTKALWAAYMRYDSDNNVIGSRVMLFYGSAANASGDIVIPEGVAYISFTYRTFAIPNVFKSYKYLNEDALIKGGIENFPFAFDKYYGHLLLNYVDEGNTFERIIPCESVFDVEMTARFGFKYMEANVHATATPGKYVVTHGISGKLGNDFMTTGGENVPSVTIAETSYDDLRTLYVYKSKYPKYRVPITSLEEFLYACRTHNVFPVLQYVDETELAIARGIVGDNLILYAGSRAAFKGYIMEYRGYTTKAEIINRCATVGTPFMYCMSNPTYFTDSQLKDIIADVHKMGCFIGHAGNYDGFPQTVRLMNLGFDFSASGGMVNDFENGNILNICGGPSFDGISTTGTVTNGALVLAEGDTVTFESDDNSFIKKFMLDMNYVGELSILFPQKTGKTGDSTLAITSDGTQDVRLGNCLLERLFSVTLTAGTGGVVINSLSLKLSKV